MQEEGVVEEEAVGEEVGEEVVVVVVVVGEAEGDEDVVDEAIITSQALNRPIRCESHLDYRKIWLDLIKHSTWIWRIFSVKTRVNVTLNVVALPEANLERLQLVCFVF